MAPASSKMIFSVQIADVGLVRTAAALRRPDPAAVAGLRYAETTITAPLSRHLLPAPRVRRVALLAAWDDDAALDRFLLSEHPIAAHLAAGWCVRMRPLRVWGAWPSLPGLPTDQLWTDPEEPVAVLTLGRLRLHRAVAFLRASARAEGEALADPALLASTGLARPPRLVATFSLWRSAAAMRDYAANRAAGAHPAAIAAHRAKPFHSEAAFIRFRPYAAQGRWRGHDPLAGLLKDRVSDGTA